MNEQFKQDVDIGLSLYPKRISSEYFYDSRGDRLFQSIMKLPEYYLTAAEEQIFKEQSGQIIRDMGWVPNLNIYELGAGDGSKTALLLKALKARGTEISYKPIDISFDVLQQLQENLIKQVKGVEVEPMQGTYFGTLENLVRADKVPHLFMFLGSNLGNFTHEESIVCLKKIASHMTHQDYLIMGLDKMKDPAIIKAAYNDSQGLTAAFNLNLLERINRELGGEFDLNRFRHEPTYDAENGLASSFLVSTVRQEVYIAALNKSFHFEAWESIHTEISQKYTRDTIEWLCESSGMQLKKLYSDSKQQFYECLITKKDEKSNWT